MNRFQIRYEVTAPVDEHPWAGRVRVTDLLANTLVEATRQVRHRYGAENAGHVRILEIASDHPCALRCAPIGPRP
jgi:hypothetical protein